MANNPITVTLPVGAAALNRYECVKTVGGVVVTAAATDVALGIVQDGASANDATCTVAVGGVSYAVAGAAITRMSVVSPTSSGEVITITGSNTRLGVALDTASAQGDLIRVLLFPDKSHTATS